MRRAVAFVAVALSLSGCGAAEPLMCVDRVLSRHGLGGYQNFAQHVPVPVAVRDEALRECAPREDAR